MEHLPQHCQGCSYLLYKMGSCPYPGVSLIYSALSTLPYLLAFLIGGLALIKRRLSYFVCFFIIASCYIFTDAYLKNIFLDPRPAGACKRSFGMPSSHMVVTANIAVLLAIHNRNDIYIGAAFSILEALARYQLQYHTAPQILAGWILGAIYATVAVKLLKKLHQKYNGLLRTIPLLIDDVSTEAHKKSD